MSRARLLLHNFRADRIRRRESQVAKAKKSIFSVTKAVKANARERVGTPPPEAVLPDEKAKAARRTSKHKTTLASMLQREEER